MLVEKSFKIHDADRCRLFGLFKEIVGIEIQP